MASGFRRNDRPIPKPPEKNHCRRPRCVLGGLTFPHSDAARNPALPSGRTSARVGAPSAPFPTQSRKLPRQNDANPLANRTNVLYPAFSKSGSTAVGRRRPPATPKYTARCPTCHFWKITTHRECIGQSHQKSGSGTRPIRRYCNRWTCARSRLIHRVRALPRSGCHHRPMPGLVGSGHGKLGQQNLQIRSLAVAPTT